MVVGHYESNWGQSFISDPAEGPDHCIPSPWTRGQTRTKKSGGIEGGEKIPSAKNSPPDSNLPRTEPSSIKILPSPRCGMRSSIKSDLLQHAGHRMGCEKLNTLKYLQGAMPHDIKGQKGGMYVDGTLYLVQLHPRSGV